MTFRIDHKAKILRVRLHRGESVFRTVGQTVWFNIPNEREPVGLSIPAGLKLEVKRASVGAMPPGWAVVK